MVRIKMRTTAAGPKGTYIAGRIVSVDEVEAKNYVDGGYAEYVKEEKEEQKIEEPEKATLEPGEKATLIRRGKGK